MYLLLEPKLFVAYSICMEKEMIDTFINSYVNFNMNANFIHKPCANYIKPQGSHVSIIDSRSEQTNQKILPLKSQEDYVTSCVRVLLVSLCLGTNVVLTEDLLY